jgi:hydrogenase-4 component F
MISLPVLIIIIPVISGIASYLIHNNRNRRTVWLFTAILHTLLSVYAACFAHSAAVEAWIGIDALSAIFLPLTSLLFLLVTIYGIGYVKREPVDQQEDPEIGGLYTNSPESVFTGSILLFLASMSLAILSRHFGLQWMAIEATTLASAPLIYYHRSKTSLEAAWKYLILCSVGIAVALMGIFFIGLALPKGTGDITLYELIRNAGGINHKWLEVAFILMLVGYGTKMGLAPLHNWLPDAHSEAPSPVSALLSGALLNCALLGILRIQQVNHAAGMARFGQDLMILFGLISMGTAGIFLLGQADYKRMLAYSSVEHMGIITLGFGIGGLGIFGALLHVINHSLVKSQLFMTAGNIHFRFHTKVADKVSGLIKVMPITGILWLAGYLAVVGSPPFGIFVSEFTILKASIAQNMWLGTGLFILFLILAFIGMTNIFIKMAFGKTEENEIKEHKISVLPAFILALAALSLGLWIPGWLNGMISEAAMLLGGGVK